MLNTRDIAWLAGLIEGEGCFTKCRESIRISIAMTDKDVIQRVADMWKSPVGVWTHREGCKIPYNTIVCGNSAAGWMMTLYPFLSERRRARVRELLAIWRAKKPRYGDNVVCGHLDRPHCALGKCSTCYSRAKARRLRSARKERT